MGKISRRSLRNPERNSYKILGEIRYNPVEPLIEISKVVFSESSLEVSSKMSPGFASEFHQESLPEELLPGFAVGVRHENFTIFPPGISPKFLATFHSKFLTRLLRIL